MQRGFVVLTIDKEGKMEMFMRATQHDADEWAEQAIKTGHYRQIAVIGNGRTLTAREE